MSSVNWSGAHLARVLALALAISLVVTGLARAAGSYTFTDLSSGIDAKGNAVTGLFADAINNNGDVAGSA